MTGAPDWREYYEREAEENWQEEYAEEIAWAELRSILRQALEMPNEPMSKMGIFNGREPGVQSFTTVFPEGTELRKGDTIEITKTIITGGESR